MNTAPGPSGAWAKEASCPVWFYSKDLFCQPLAPWAGLSDAKGTGIWLRINSGCGPPSGPSHAYQNSQNNAHPDAGLYMASSASKQTLHNVKTNWQPKSSFVSRSIHPAMCKLWCPPEAENGTERWEVMGKAGLAVGAGRIPPHKAPGCSVSRGKTLNTWAPMSSWGSGEGVEPLQKRHMSLQGWCLC